MALGFAWDVHGATRLTSVTSYLSPPQVDICISDHGKHAYHGVAGETEARAESKQRQGIVLPACLTFHSETESSHKSEIKLRGNLDLKISQTTFLRYSVVNLRSFQ